MDTAGAENRAAGWNTGMAVTLQARICLSSHGCWITTAWAPYRAQAMLQGEAMLQTKSGAGERALLVKSLLHKLNNPNLISKPILKIQAEECTSDPSCAWEEGSGCLGCAS